MNSIEYYLNDPSINEILVNGFNKTWIETQGRLEEAPPLWASDIDYTNYVRFLLHNLNSDLSIQEPFCSGRIGDFRVQISGPPVTQEPIISFRRVLPQSLPLNSWSKYFSGSDIETLKHLVQAKENILIFGSTGSGKTTLLSSLLSEVAPNERVLVLEDIEELKVPNEASVRLLSRTDPMGVMKSITLSDLVKQSLRLRPDRLALGEVRGPEAKDLLMALATGHRGSLGTLHAHSMNEALLRLEMLVQLCAPQWQTKSIRQLILLSVQIVIGIEKRPDGTRRLVDISRITGLEDFGFLTERI